MARILFKISSMKGITSSGCNCRRMHELLSKQGRERGGGEREREDISQTWIKCRLHFCAILMKVSHAMSCTPSWVSCMNSNNLFTTVLRNFQCALCNQTPTKTAETSTKTAQTSTCTWTDMHFLTPILLSYVPKLVKVLQRAIHWATRVHANLKIHSFLALLVLAMIELEKLVNN